MVRIFYYLLLYSKTLRIHSFRSHLKNEEQQNIHVANGENKYFVSTLQQNLKHQYVLI